MFNMEVAPDGVMADRNRRDVLKGTAGLATVAMSGLAGCSAITGGGPDCGRPGGDLEDALPGEQVGQFFRDREPDTGVADGASVVGSARARYSGPDGNTYVYTIYEYESSSEAESAWEDGGDTEMTSGYVVTGKYVYGVTTESGTASGIQNLLVATDNLSLTCVEDHAETKTSQGTTSE